MQPLLKITTVPIKVEFRTKRAALEHKYTPPRVTVTRQKGNFNIQTRRAKVEIDTYEARASAGLKSANRSIQEFAQTGQQDARAATRAYAEDGNAILDSHSKNAIAEQAAAKLPRPAETVMTFIPATGPEFTVDPGDISFDIGVDKLAFDWNINHKPQLEYVPGSIEFEVTQYPDVIIEYLGSPIYAPPSADPNYAPPPGLDKDA